MTAPTAGCVFPSKAVTRPCWTIGRREWMQPGVTDDMRRGRLSLRSLAWHHLRSERASSAGVALALVLALLPAGLLVVESSGAGSDPRTGLAASAGRTATLTAAKRSQ